MVCKVCKLEHDLSEESTPFKIVCIETLKKELDKSNFLMRRFKEELEKKIKENELLKARILTIKHSVND